jgi:HAD superfamily hydrolase (TIGR01509 family)
LQAKRFDLAIFDCDGVLVDSELITARVFAAMLNELGLHVSIEDMFDKFVGRAMPQCLLIIHELLGRAAPTGFLDEYRARTAAVLRRDLAPVAGIAAALDGIGTPYCVASSGTHEKMQLTLGLTGLLPRFAGRIFSVDDVARSKPYPDVYLYAAKTLGVTPGRCAVIEDTPTGVTAGVAAGMTVFGYCRLMPRARLQDAGAKVCFDDMSALPGLLQWQPSEIEGRLSSSRN